MKFTFKIFHESTKPANAKRAIAHMNNHNRAGFTILHVEPYLHKGCVAQCEREISASSWSELVINVISFAQTFGIGWVISRSIEQELDLATTRFHAGNGVTMADIYISRAVCDL